MGTKYGWEAWLGRAEMKGVARAVKILVLGGIALALAVVLVTYLFSQ